MRSEAQRKADAAYRKKMNRLTLDFKAADSDIWDYVQNQSNKQAYIKNLIRADMKKEQA